VTRASDGARGALDVTALLESFQQARDSGRREQHALCQIDPAQPPAFRVREVEQHFVVVDRQAVVRHELRVEATRRRRVRPYQPDPGRQLQDAVLLACSILDSSTFSANIVDGSSIANSKGESQT
jgi:hypothetical protein